MPRNGSGTYAVPTSFTPASVISSSAMNADLADIGAEITNSLPRDGQAAMNAPVKATDGTAALPSLTFATDTNTGVYRKASDQVGFAAGGVAAGYVDAAGFVDPAGLRMTGEPPGVMKDYLGTAAPAGYVLASGRTIGNAASGGTERANGDTATLFSLLWSSYSDALMPVSGGRGASAAADYAANKTIAVPDLRGRVAPGKDDMGGTAANRITVGQSGIPGTTLGGVGGLESVVLSAGTLPVITPTFSGNLASLGSGTVTAMTQNSGSLGAGGDTARQLGINGTQTVALPNFTPSGSVSSFGGGGSHNNMPPVFMVNKIIKL